MAPGENLGRLEGALRESEEQRRLALEAAALGTWDWDIVADRALVDERCRELFGFTGNGPIDYGTVIASIHPDDRAAVQERVRRALDPCSNGTYESEYRVVRPDGSVCWLFARGLCRFEGEGDDRRAVRFVGTVMDITDRKHAEEALADSAARLRLIADAMPVLISYVDAEVRYRFVNMGYETWFGYARSEIEGRTLREVLGEEAFAGIREHVRAALAGRAVRFESVVPYRKGGARHVEARYMPHRGPNGEVLGFYALVIDISERKRAEAAMARAAGLRRAILDAVPANIAVLDGAGNIVATNAAWDRFALENGYSGPRPWTKVNYLAVCDAARGASAEGAAAVARGIRAVIAGKLKRFTPDAEYACHAPRKKRWFELIAVPLSDKPAEGAVVMHVEMTERRETEHALREREAQLRQAQKMEALGQLTGGVAHDFNNLLALVMMDLELIGELAGPDGKIGELASEARSVAQTGADLILRLLAFARRQHLAPRAVDLNALITAMVDMLERSLGEMVEIRTDLGESLWLAQADPAQLENAILNLAINARDAMPQGGTITITTANERVIDGHAQLGLSPGDFVTVTVADTGAGMPPEVRERAFEPFFTTKAAGRGTGLGLSMVYGFVQQSGGQVGIRSEVGRGTEVTLRLPRAAIGVAPTELRARPASVDGAGEVILVVEDHAALRERVADALAELGYRVLTASNAAEALRKLDGRERVDLLFTDIVMPGDMDGRELAERVGARWPQVRVLYTTGYADHLPKADQLARGDKVVKANGLGFPVLAKPYSLQELARVVHQVLGRADRAASA